MAQLFTDFSDTTVGNLPANMTARRNSTESTYTVQSDGGDPVLRYLATTGGAAPRGVSYDLAPSSGVVELFFETRDIDNSSPASGRFVVFASDDPDSEYGIIWSQVSGGSLLIYKRTSGSYSMLESTSRFVESDYTLVRFRVTPGSPNRLQARLWPTGNDEPTTWTIDVTDTAAISAGWIGHVGFAQDDRVFYKRVGIGTDGQPAPMSAGEAAPPTPAVTTTDTLTPGATVTVTCSNFTTYPTSVSLLDSSDVERLSLTLTQVAGDEHTFTIPAAPSADASVQLMKDEPITLKFIGGEG